MFPFVEYMLLEIRKGPDLSAYSLCIENYISYNHVSWQAHMKKGTKRAQDQTILAMPGIVLVLSE